MYLKIMYIALVEYPITNIIIVNMLLILKHIFQQVIYRDRIVNIIKRDKENLILFRISFPICLKYIYVLRRYLKTLIIHFWHRRPVISAIVQSKKPPK